MSATAGQIWMHWAGDLWPSPAPWAHFSAPLRVLRAHQAAEVAPLLRQAEAELAAGNWVAGYLAYEAAPGFDPALAVVSPAPGAAADSPVLPLAWFGVYAQPEWHAAPPSCALHNGSPCEPAAAAPIGGAWAPTVSADAYHAALARVREYIAAGDTYQVNLTYALRAALPAVAPGAADAAWALWGELRAAQPAPYAAWLDLGPHAIASVSPELFFAQAGDRLLTRPMKGTAPRGRFAAEDEPCAAALLASAKNRAENLMIVDLLRNDLGRVARPGSVCVERLFALERYPTLWQLTSTIAAQSRATPAEVLAALFPCGSITGAPKVRTMQIIAELERRPRGIYTGAIGAIGPGRIAQFNVAIRTAEIDRAAAVARYGVGGGVTWDSAADEEHAETRLKAQVLTRRAADFELLETIRWQPPALAARQLAAWAADPQAASAAACPLLPYHLARLRESAEYFDFRCPGADELTVRLWRAAEDAGGAAAAWRLRMLLDARGQLRIEATALAEALAGRDGLRPPILPSAEAAYWRLRKATRAVDSREVFLCHKTTQRAPYLEARADVDVGQGACDEVLLWNEDGVLTEASTANIVLPTPGGPWLTPPRTAGLLAGVYRAELLAQGCLREATIPRDALAPGMRLWLINALRGWLPAIVVE